MFCLEEKIVNISSELTRNRVWTRNLGKVSYLIESQGDYIIRTSETFHRTAKLQNNLPCNSLNFLSLCTWKIFQCNYTSNRFFPNMRKSSTSEWEWKRDIGGFGDSSNRNRLIILGLNVLSISSWHDKISGLYQIPNWIKWLRDLLIPTLIFVIIRRAWISQSFCFCSWRFRRLTSYFRHFM